MILKILGIVITKNEMTPFRRIKTYKKLNIWNPLTYIFILVISPFGIIAFGFKDFVIELKKSFSWK